MALTTADLLNGIKRRGIIPTSQTTFSDADILGLATDVLRSEFVPMIVQLNEEYFSFSESVSSSSTLEVAFPKRASGAVLKNVYHKDANGEIRELRRYSPAERVSKKGVPNAFYIGWNKVYLLDDQLSTGELEFHFFIEPGKLVSLSSAARITGIDTDTGILNLSILPDAFQGSTKIDFIKGRSPYEYLTLDNVISSVDTDNTTITFASVPDELEISDYACIEGETCLVQLPDAFQPALIEQVCIDILQSLGDRSVADRFQERLNKKLSHLIEMMSPRVKYQEKKIIAPGGDGGVLF